MEKIGIPVILQGLYLNGDEARRNSTPMISLELEPNGDDVIDPNGSDIIRNSMPEIPQDMDIEGGDVSGKSVLGIPQEIDPNVGDIIRSSIENVDPPSEIQRNSTPVISHEMEPSGDDRNPIAVIQQDIELNDSDIKLNSILVIPHEMEPSGDDRNPIAVIQQEIELNDSDIKQNSIPAISQEMEPKVEISQEIEPNVSGTRRNSMPAIPPEKEPKGDDTRRNSMPAIPHEKESKGGDTRRNYLLVIPNEIEPNGDDIRRSSIRMKIQSRYLRPPIGSCHDYCKYGLRHDFQEETTALPKSRKATIAMTKSDTLIGSAGQSREATTSAEKKKISTTSPNPSANSDTQKLDNTVVTEKEVISLTKKETVSSKKVPSLSKESDIFAEDSIHLKVQHEKLEPSSLPGLAVSLRSSKLLSTVGRKCFPDSKTQKLNNSVVMEKKVSLSTKKETVSSKKVSSPKEIDVCTEQLVDLEGKAEQLEPFALPRSVLSLSNAKVISTVNPMEPDSETQNFDVLEEKVSFPIKDIDVSTEDSINSMVKLEQVESSSLSGSVLSLSSTKVLSTISPKLSPDSEIQNLNHSAVTEKGVLSLKKKEAVSSKKVSTAIREIDVSTEGSVNAAVKTEQQSSRRKSKETPEGSSNRVDRKVRSKHPRTSALGQKKLEPRTVSLTSKNPVKRVSNVKNGSSSNLKGLSHLKDPNSPSKVEPEGHCNKDIPEKILYVIESNTENSTVKPSPDGVDAPKLSSSSSLPLEVKSLKQGRKGIGIARSPPSSEKKNLKHVVKGGSTRSSVPLYPNNKGLRRSARTSLSSSSSASSSMSQSPYESTHNQESGATSQRNTKKTDNGLVNLKVEHKTKPRKSEILSSESKNNSSRKLTFRRGRVLDLKPEINTPRRLKFRRVRWVGDIQNSKGYFKGGSTVRKEVDDSPSNSIGIKKGSIWRKEVDDSQSNGSGIKRGTVGRKEVGDNQSNGLKSKSEKVVMRTPERDVEGFQKKIMRRKVVSDGGLNGTKTSPEKVVLRHQDFKGRKDEQKLFNNVIEETASKLAETRKSKVKALVGAFETVISLQDTKPSATAGAS